MRDIAIVSFSQLPSERRAEPREEGEFVQAIVADALNQVGLSHDDVGFTVSGSSDYLIGRPFSFVAAVDGLKAWPPIRESHVEMDGAFALYEAWVRLLHGDIDVAMAFSFGKGSASSEAAKSLLYPKVTADESEHAPQYVKSHGSYAPGEQRVRAYNWRIDPSGSNSRRMKVQWQVTPPRSPQTRQRWKPKSRRLN